MLREVFIRAAAAMTLLLAGCSSTSDAGPSLQLELTVPFAPQLVRSADYQHLAYEIDFSEDFRSKGYSLSRLDVLDGASESSESTVLRSIGCDTLAERQMFPPASGLTIPMMPIWLKLGLDKTAPTSLTHRFQFVRDSDRALVTINGAKTTVVTTAVRIIAPPLKGERIAAFETSDELTHHFRSPVMAGSLTRNPQRFAIDFMALSVEGRLFSGTGKANTDYPGWGMDYLAVAEGTVKVARDGTADHPECWTGSFDDATRANPAGNHVIIDIGQGQYAVYGHCQNGSVAVRVGDKVTAGQVVCKMGNTGISDCPHMHFQISNAEDVFNAESVPYVVDKYLITGTADPTSVVTNEGRSHAVSPTRQVTERLLDLGAVVTFGP